MVAAGSYRPSRSKNAARNRQGAADHVGVARVVIVADRHGEVIEGSQRVAVFGLEAAQVGRKV